MQRRSREKATAGQSQISVLVFNAIWWTIPLASLELSILRPTATRETLSAIDGWVRRHQRSIVTVLFAAVGTYLIVRGAANLLG